MRCYRCMKEFDKGYEICPHCGYIHTADVIEPFQLPPGTMLQERYWIGMMIGFGGFGITYKAFDTKLNVTVAIKEYYPAGLANRVSGTTMVQNDFENKEQEFQYGLEHFIEEARNIAKFSEHPNIVKVYHFFRENQTGYIVMEYLDGITMGYFLEVNGEKISVMYAKEIILAVAQALQVLHKAGILHRDISPDNIFLCSDGKIKLIDFGSSRLSKNADKDVEIIVKPGYAPPEQYQKDGKQGNWTDIYALGATFYRGVTGRIPPESVEREKEDSMLSPRSYNEDVPAYMNAAILKAMALDARERFASIDDFIEVLSEHRVVAIPKTKQKKKENRQKTMLSVLLLSIFFCVAGLLVLYVKIRNNGYMADEIEVWVCAKENEDVAAVEAYYQELNKELLSGKYENLNVRIHVEEESVYEERLLEAFSGGRAPDIFDSTILNPDGEWMKHAIKVKNCTEILEQLQGKDFIEKYGSALCNGKRIPMGLDLPVLYTLQSVDEGKNVDTSAVYESQDDPSDRQTLQAFAQGRMSYLCGDVTDYHQIKEAVYGTYEQPNTRVTGLLHMYAIGNEELSFSTAFSVNQDCSVKEKKAAYVYLQALLSDEGQVLMHIPQDHVLESNAIPVNRNGDKDGLYSILEETLE